MISQLRHLSLFRRSAATAAGDLSGALSSRPKITGNGPFIELPKFEPIGSPSDLLLISMPQTSRVNVRDGALLAVNGNLEDIETTSNQGFQEISAGGALSLVIKNNGTYSLIENQNKDTKWLILKQLSIIAWSGYDLELQPKKVHDKWLSYESTGKGYIVLSGTEELVEFTLKDKEEIIVNPGSLVATNGDTSLISVQSIWGPSSHLLVLLKQYLPELPRFKLPTVGISGGIVNSVKSTLSKFWNTVTEPLRVVADSEIWQNSVKYSSAVYGWLKLNVYVRIAAKPMYLKLVGPGKVLVDAAQLLKSNSGYFSNHEILAAYEQK